MLETSHFEHGCIHQTRNSFSVCEYGYNVGGRKEAALREEIPCILPPRPARTSSFAEV